MPVENISILNILTDAAQLLSPKLQQFMFSSMVYKNALFPSSQNIDAISLTIFINQMGNNNTLLLSKFLLF